MKTSEILIAAKALIDQPEKWTQHHAARNADGEQSSFNPATKEFTGAVCYCSWGALYAVEKLMPATYSDAWNTLCDSAIAPISFNDAHGRKHSEVMAMYDKAIRLAEFKETTAA